MPSYPTILVGGQPSLLGRPCGRGGSESRLLGVSPFLFSSWTAAVQAYRGGRALRVSSECLSVLFFRGIE